jgi:hypothetical protein
VPAAGCFSAASSSVFFAIFGLKSESNDFGSAAAICGSVLFDAGNVTAFYANRCHPPNIVALVRRLDANLALRDGDEHAIYAQFNGIAHQQHMLLAYLPAQLKAAACGEMMSFASESVEVKRMWMTSKFCGRNVVLALLL